MRKQPVKRSSRRSSVTTPENKVFSYYNNRPKDSAGQRGSRSKKGNTQPGQLSRWFRNLPAIIALLAVGFSVLYCLGLSNQPQIIIAPPTNVGAVPPLRSKTDYQAGASKILSNSPLSRTKLTINTHNFRADFLKKYPEVADVSITLPLISQQPIVTLEEAQPALLLGSSNHLVVVDTSGRVIMYSQSLLPAVRKNLITVTDQSGLQASLGRSVLSGQDISFISTVVAQVRAQHLIVQSVTLPAQSQELDIRLTGQPYAVKFDLGTDPKQAVGTFLALKAFLDRQKQTPASYIDVRIAGRVYYK